LLPIKSAKVVASKGCFPYVAVSFLKQELNYTKEGSPYFWEVTNPYDYKGNKTMEITGLDRDGQRIILQLPVRAL